MSDSQTRPQAAASDSTTGRRNSWLVAGYDTSVSKKLEVMRSSFPQDTVFLRINALAFIFKQCHQLLGLFKGGIYLRVAFNSFFDFHGIVHCKHMVWQQWPCV